MSEPGGGDIPRPNNQEQKIPANVLRLADPAIVREGLRREWVTNLDFRLEQYEAGILSRKAFLRGVGDPILNLDRQNEMLRKRLEREQGRSLFDPVTNLPNEYYFKDELDDLIDKGKDFSVVLIDFDNFKGINDKYGHAIGDDALRHRASIIQEVLDTKSEDPKTSRRRQFVLARLHGDEFAVILESVDSEEELADITGEMVTSAAENPMQEGDITIPGTLSVAAARYRGGDRDAFLKILDAKGLMNGAKQTRNAFKIITIDADQANIA